MEATREMTIATSMESIIKTTIEITTKMIIETIGRTIRMTGHRDSDRY